MTLAKRSKVTKTKDEESAYQGGLARTLVRTLVLFTFIPLLLMAGAAYFRTRGLLRQQVVNETQAQMTTQLSQMELAVKTKDIRLDRLLRNPDFANQIASTLSSNPQSATFTALRNEIDQTINDLGSFNQFMLMSPDGIIRLASKPEWEGVSVKDDQPSFHTFFTHDGQSFLMYNVSNLYPNQLVLATIVGYRDTAGARAATLIAFTEAQNLDASLQSLINLYPSAKAYFVTQNIETKNFVGADPYTNELTAFQPSEAQDTSLTTALDNLMNVENNGPRALEYSAADGQAVLSEAAWSDTLQAGVVLEIPQNASYR